MKTRLLALSFALVPLLIGNCSEKSAPPGAGTGGSAGGGEGGHDSGGRQGQGGSQPVAPAGGSSAGGTSAGATRAGGAGAAGGLASGGAVGSGGAGPGGAGSGGTRSDGSTGGASGSGGARGAGGVPGAGGTTGVGGTPGAGGTTGAGGGAGGSLGGSAGTSGSSTTVDATAMAKAMGFGANIGNTFDNTTSWETGWGQPLVTQAFINGMAKNGIKTVRVPVAWDTYAQNGVINASDLSRVKQVVGWILAAGMYAIVNIHWDGGWIYNEGKSDVYQLTDDVKTKFASYWKQIASGFADVGNMLIFEGLNEEGNFWVNGNSSGTPDYAALNQLNQLFVTTVRAQSGYNATRALLIAGFTTDITKTCVDAFGVPTDPAGQGKLFLSIHYYDPYTFTLMEDPASWGSPSATWGTDADKQALTASFTKLGTFSTSKKIPVIIGEFAVTKGQKVVRQPASRTLWMASVAQAAMSRGMVPVLWDTGTDISRSDGSLSSDLQGAMNALK